MMKLTQRERVLLLLLAVVAAISGYVMLFHLPMTQRIESLQTEIAQGQQLVTQLETQLNEQQRMQRTIREMSEREDAPPVMPAYDNFQAVMTTLHAILSDCQEYSISFEQQEAREHVVRRRATIPFVCANYTVAKNTIQRLHDSVLRSLVEDVQLSQEANGTVRATVSMVFFEYQAETEDTEEKEN